MVGEFTFGSLFAGIGGFELGFERAGLRCAWQVEIDGKCNQVLLHHWSDVKRYGDVKDVGKRNLETIDLLVGGFPCQDVSVAGRRAGLDGKRSGLWFEFIRIVEELKPKWVVVENVPGLLSSNEKRDFAVVLSGLGECGYWWAYRILDAQNYGVPQRRRRVFVVGCLAKGRAQEVLFERESSPWDTPPGREAGKEAARIVGTLAANTGPRGHDAGNFMSNQAVDAGYIQTAEIHGGSKRKDRPQGGFYIREMPTSKPLDTSGLNPNCAQGGTVVYQCHGSNVGPMGTLRKGNGGITSGVPFVAHPLAHGQTIDHYDESQQTYIAAWNWQSGGDVRYSFGKPNLQASQVPAVGIRRLTPTECERLQGFPDGWTAVNGMNDGARYRMLGNAVCVPVAEWLGQRILTVDKEK